MREKESDSSQGPDQELKLLLARSLCRFGMLQRRLGDAEARGSLERALAIQEAELGERPSADRARTLLELARWFDEEGQEFCAKALIDRSIEELKAVAPGSPMLVEAYGLAARLTSSAEAGLRMVEEGLSLSRSLYGEDTPRTAQLFLTRAELRRRDKRASFAIGDALDAHRISLQHVVAMIQAFPRDQALAFAADRRRGLDLALDMLAQNPGLHATHTAEVWQAAIASRRLVLDAEIERRRVLQATAEPRLAALAQELIAARQQFAYLLVQTYGRSQNLAGRLETARRRVITAEAALARETRPLLAADRDVSIEDLQRRLLPGSALVGVLQYRPSAGAHDAYLAMVLTGGGPPRPVALGDAASVDSLIAAWRESLLSYRGTERPAQTRRRLGMALRRRIWDPLASLLGPPGIVFFVPDGALQRVPLAALPTDDAHYLLEVGWSFHVLTGEQDLLEGPGERRTGPLLALGGIDYDSLSPQVAFARASASAGAKAAPASDHYPSRGEDADCLGPRLPFFEPLPGSLEEVRELVVMWKRMRHAGGRSCPVTLLTEARATEAAFRSAVGKHRVVHFATHGFVASSSGPVRRSGVRGIGGLSFGSVPTGGALPRPLSGLALAGANQRDTARNNDQDGILTEAEILDLDLDGVDWVVLSACGTGLGRIEPVEGVLGIRRAFQIAGAGTLILSLWSIDDLATRDWMRDLYAARFGRGLTTIESIRHASLEALARRRRQGDDNPALWAGFVATGKWN